MRLALFLFTLVLFACEAAPPAASAPTPTSIPTEQSVEPPTPTITPTPTEVPEPTSTAVSTPTPEPTATLAPTPIRTPRSLLPEALMTPIPTLPAVIKYVIVKQEHTPISYIQRLFEASYPEYFIFQPVVFEDDSDEIRPGVVSRVNIDENNIDLILSGRDDNLIAALLMFPADIEPIPKEIIHFIAYHIEGESRKDWIRTWLGDVFPDQGGYVIADERKPRIVESLIERDYISIKVWMPTADACPKNLECEGKVAIDFRTLNRE